MFATKYLVRLNYKSGHSVEFWTWKLEYKHVGGSVRELTWQIVSGSIEPAVMNIDAIESIWLVKRRLGFKGFKKS